MLPLLWLMTAPWAVASEVEPVATADFDRIVVGVAQTAGVRGAAAAVSDLGDAPASLEIAYHAVRTSRVFRRVGTTQRVHIARDASGRVVLEDLHLASQFVALHARPAQGDLLALSLVGGAWDQIWWSGVSPALQLQLFSPFRLTLLGLSDTDEDDDTRLKVYAGVGAGGGAEALLRVFRGFGLHGRVEAGAESRRRHQGDAPDPVRHDVWARGEVSLAWLQPDVAWSVGVWGEHRTQWASGHPDCGIDRQVVAGGFRLAGRLFRAPPAAESEDDGDPEALPDGDAPD